MYTSFTDMPVWQKSMDLAVEVFTVTVSLPKSEDYGLTSQLRRSANSVSANISEGFGRNSNKDKCQFYIVARGSAYETQNHLLYGNRVGYFSKQKSDELISQYGDLIFEINKLIKTLSKPQSQP